MLTGAQLLRVFSAHAEVVPILVLLLPKWICILRARGGSSYPKQIQINAIGYSPRTRR